MNLENADIDTCRRSINMVPAPRFQYYYHRRVSAFSPDERDLSILAKGAPAIRDMEFFQALRCH